jgi:hypothetical protein
VRHVVDLDQCLHFHKVLAIVGALCGCAHGICISIAYHCECSRHQGSISMHAMLSVVLFAAHFTRHPILSWLSQSPLPTPLPARDCADAMPTSCVSCLQLCMSWKATAAAAAGGHGAAAGCWWP